MLKIPAEIVRHVMNKCNKQAKLCKYSNIYYFVAPVQNKVTCQLWVPNSDKPIILS